ncbi:MAG: DUF3179 domain-containing protein [Lewinellaceae bacterium]|nr:DUF3179 domain-containing protein [Lewinella sp.]MCB9279295.1 DUF3179 domain-containing protein [Lewinellaceae bacterium]
MKKFFYLGALGLILFEIADIYFIMPMPGSQQMESIGLAYFLYKWRWAIRAVFGGLMIAGFPAAFKGSKIFSLLLVAAAGAVVYNANFVMAADAMFRQPENLRFAAGAESAVDTGRLVLGVEYGGEAKAYPIQFIGYHHQVFDTVGGKPVIVTYCTVCRTGRVFEPVVNGKTETFRLVGMDHFNAMFEDKTTKSWWRQVNGEAIAGKLTGAVLPEMPSSQMVLGRWLRMYPATRIMQPDPAFAAEYDSLANYEAGRRKGALTRRDTVPWAEKAWVVGVATDREAKAYDWVALEKERIIYDRLGSLPIALVLAGDNKSFTVLQRAGEDQRFTLQNDTLFTPDGSYNLVGKSHDPAIPDLKKLNASQEYWHSWRTFHPATAKY